MDKEETKTAVATAAQDTTQVIDKIMASISKVNEQIDWINDHPDEQTAEQAEKMKRQLVRTKQVLLSQLDEHDSEDRVHL